MSKQLKRLGEIMNADEFDRNWEHVPDFIKPESWVHLKPNLRNYKGIYEPFQLSSHPPIKVDGCDDWFVRSDKYCILLSVKDLMRAKEPADHEVKRLQKEVNKLNKKMDRLKTELEPILLCAAKIYNTGSSRSDLPLDTLPRLNSAAKILGV